MKVSSVDAKINSFMDLICRKNPNEPEFHQAVREVAESVFPYLEAHPIYQS